MNKQSEKLKVKGEKYKICATDFEGITLVALVITIIVLIILAGVSINAVMNQGLITNAKDAKEEFDKGKDAEQLEFAKLEGIVAVETLKEVKAGGYTGEENCRYLEGGKIAVIPAGFTVSNVPGEDTISGGLVIYAGNHSTVADMTTIQSTANQYVWIPVDNPSDMYGVLESPVEGIEGNKFGKLYFKTLTDSSTKYNWPTGGRYSKTSYREPDYLTDATYADESDYNKDASGNKIITKDVIQKEFNDMITSVEKYKGFYIGRYELTGTSYTTPTILKGTNPMVNTNWYNFYLACKNLEAGNEKAKNSVKTTMIWGCQWDQAIKTILSVEEFSDFLTNAKKYGVYLDSETYTTIGQTARMASAYNIYDMGGNVCDWTLEACTNEYRVYRGGKADDEYYSSSSSPASGREGDAVDAVHDGWGCRAQLYIK